MALKSLFATSKPRGFNYQPRYYDARKEAMQHREARIKRELGLSAPDAPFIPSVKGRIQKSRRLNKKDVWGGKVAVFLLLAIIAYLLLSNPELVKHLVGAK